MNIQRLIKQHQNQIIILSGVLVASAIISDYLLNLSQVGMWAMMLASIVGGIPIMIQAYQALRNKVISIELLVSIAVIGAFFIGEYYESGIVTFLFLFGAYLERRTIEKTRKSVKSLVEMAPTTALLIDESGEAEEVDIEFVEKEDRLLVKTGSKVPVDGLVLVGEGFVDEATITGESFPVKKKVGDHVFAGTILNNGTLQIEAQRVGEDTTFGKIIELVEEAQDSKSVMEKFINKFSKYYTPVVLIFALVTYLFTQDIRLAITILVLGCPGALVIGVPVSNVTGIGNGAKHGVLIKGGEVMDRMNQVDTMVFDKTGTLTQGTTAVTTFISLEEEEEKSLAYLMAIEKESDHPLAKAIVAYLGEKNIRNPYPVQSTTVLEGRGIQAIVQDEEVLIGNERLLKERGLTIATKTQKEIQGIKEQGNSIVLVTVSGELRFVIGVSDVIRPEAKKALMKLRKMGIKRFVMLTGDNQITAQAVATQLGIDEVKAELLPADKVKEVQKLKDTGHIVAFVGDGINDSPSIALADIGIAMGSGTDVAVETSDIVLMRSSFDELVHAFGLTRATIFNMRQNIGISLATVGLLFVGLFAGFIYMASGMFVHEASILFVILNGLRLMKFRVK